jgi:hypothetical protein
MLLKLNLAQARMLSEALAQYLESPAGQEVAGGNVTVAERLLKELNAYMADPDQQAAEQTAAEREERQRKAIEGLLEHFTRLDQERRRLASERRAAEEARRADAEERLRKSAEALEAASVSLFSRRRRE